MKDILLINYIYPKTADSVSGRNLGIEVRDKIGFEQLDESDEIINIVIPITLENINPSYFLGLLGKSVRKLTESGFRDKYKFDILSPNSDVVESLKNDIEVGIRRALKDRGVSNATN